MGEPDNPRPVPAGAAVSQTGDDSDLGPEGSFQYKLNRLFRTVIPAGRSTPYTNKEVADGIAAMGGSIAESYLSLLRRGTRDNPTLQHIQAIAGFFKVDASYFLDTERSRVIDEQLELLAAMRDADVQQIATRAVGMSPRSRKALLTILGEVDELDSKESG